MKVLLSVTATAVALALSGCDQVINRQPSTAGLGGAGGNNGAGGGHGTPPGGQTNADGLPCDVQAMVAKYCSSCHGSKPSGGAPRSLVTYADLTRKDLMTPGLTEAEASLQRMKSSSSPMPPAPSIGPTSSEIAMFQSWISNNYPTGTCGVTATGGSTSNGGGGNAGSGSGGGGGAAGGAGGSTSGGTTPPSGLPCDVQAVFVSNCASCHGSTPSGGAPRALVTYANLTMADPANPSLSEAQVAVQRMQSSVAPMPPSPSSPVSSSDIAIVQKWISSGYPKGTCGQSTGGSGGNGGGTGGSASGRSSSAGSGGSAGTSGNDGGIANGLPCDIQSIVTNHCVSCHGNSPSGGAPRSLVTYANLTMPDPANAGMTEAQVSLQRMQNTAAPMPPAPAARVSSSEISAWQSWVNAGYPKGTCGGGGAGGSGGSAGGTGGSSGAGGSSGGNDAGVPGGVLPCDVQTLLVNKCASCHGTAPAGGAPRSLVTYANLTMADPANPSMTEAQVALQRMQSTASPMPPSPASPATSAEIASLQNWINGGYASGPACSGDAGTVGPDPLNASPTCTSKSTWTGGNRESPLMNPGQACIACHSRSGEAPRFVIAGTLYPTGHEPDNCNGVNGTSGAKVVVTGNSGTSITLTPNNAGNFYSSTSLPGPYKVKVVSSTGKERVMASAAPNGDCNSCHTQSGTNSAPGRITLP